MGIKHICVYGLGGIGGSVGGLIAHKLAGDRNCGIDISFIARGEHLHLIDRNGLELYLPNNERLLCKPTYLSSSVVDVPVPDIVFVGVKAYDCADTAKELDKNISNHSVVIPLLNGFDIYDRMRRHLTRGSICPASVYFGGRKFAPGKVKLALPGDVYYGKDPQSEKLDETVVSTIGELFENTPLKFTCVENPYPAIWKKYIMNVGLNMVMAYSKRVLGEILADPDLKRLLKNIMDETAKIARTQYDQLPEGVVDDLMAAIEKFPYETKSSFAVDIEKNSPKNEGDIFGEAIINLGRKIGKPVSAIEGVYRKIQCETA